MSKRRKSGYATICKVCSRKEYADYRVRNIEKVREKSRIYGQANAEKRSESAAKRYVEKRDHILAVCAKYRAENPEKRIFTTRKYKLLNKESVAQKNANWYQKNKVRVAEYHADFYQKNRLMLLKKGNEWKRAHPENRRAWEAKRRAIKRGTGGQFSPDDLRLLMRLQRNKCAVCRTDISQKSHADHVIPLALGGPSDKTNIQMLCPTCNYQKHAKHPVDFMQSKGFLL